MVAGVGIVWFSFSTWGGVRAPVIIGSLLAGIGETLMLLGWLIVLTQHPADNPLLVIILAFGFALGLYAILLFVPAVPGLVIETALPILSLLCALRWTTRACATDSAAPSMGTVFQAASLPMKKRVGVAALLLFLWFNFAYFRYIASPWHLVDNPTYYLALSAAAVVTVVVLGIWLYRHRPKDYRAGVFCVVILLSLSYAILYIDFDNTVLGIISFMIVFACLVGTQVVLRSLSLDTIARNTPGAAFDALLYWMVSGVGIALGVLGGNRLCVFCHNDIPPSLPMLFMVGLFFLAFLVLSPKGGSRAERTGSQDDPTQTALGAESSPIETFAAEYNLSQREVDVLELLLKGRNRPYIAQNLFISPGTVNTHISHIFTKTGVNSVQQLITKVSDSTR